MTALNLNFYFYFVLATLGLSEACTDGVLLVGGRNQEGPQQEVKLLRDSGWCQTSGFPNITEPLDNPGVYYMSGVLLVCGFTTGSPCKYTSQGWESWSDVHTDFEDVGYKMVYSSKVGSVMSVSKSPFSNTQNHIQHNPVVINPLTNTLIPWMEISGSPFSILTGGSGGITNSYMDVSNSCLGSYHGDLVLSGGFSYRYCTRCTYGTSESHVVTWSVSGNSANNGPPAFEQGVIPGLTNSREAHSCVEFEGMFLVVGGYGHTYNSGPNGDPSESFRYESSGEYYDGVAWQQAASLTTARAHFSLEEMCGSLVSIGGQSDQLEYLDTVERLWTIWNSWIPADYLSLPQPRAHAGSAAVSNLDCWQ